MSEARGFVEPRRECPVCTAHVYETGHPTLVHCFVCGTATPITNCKEVTSDPRTSEFEAQRVGA